MSSRRVAWLCVLGLAACGGKAAPKSPPAAEKAAAPDTKEDARRPKLDLEALDKREAESLSAHKIIRGTWTGEVLAAKPPTVETREVLWSVNVDIGSEAPVQCFVYKNAVDPGGAFVQFLSLLDKAEADVQRAATRSLEVVRDTPTLFVDAVYTVKADDANDGTVNVGLLKIGIHAHELHPIACVHDEVGYRKTHAAVLSSLATSIAGLPPPPEPQFVEINRITAGEATLGFSFLRLRKSPEGGNELFETEVLVLPKSPAELVISDYVTRKRVDAAGYLSWGRWVKTNGHDLTMQVDLTRKKGGSYSYEGDVEGKHVSGVVNPKSKLGFLTDVSLSRALAKGLKKKAAFEVVGESWDPNEDVAKATETRFKVQPSGEFVLPGPHGTTTGTLSPDGRIEKMELPLSADVKLRAERVLHKGSL